MQRAIIWIVVLIIIVGGGYWLWQSGVLSRSQAPTSSQTATTTPQAQSGLPTSQSDTSDQALSQDSAAIDTQIQGYSQDQTSVNSSLNDQPVSQSY